MPRIAIVKEVGAPVASVWALLADFADVSWIPVARRVEIAGEGIGMSRSIYGGGDVPAVETLTLLDHDGMRLGYSIADVPLPVSRFEALVSVAPVQSGAAITFDVDYEPLGPTEVDADAAAEAVEAVYGMIAGWLADACTVRGRP
ncbi:SRPBCC family protein [Mycolicibacterium sp. BiH015]|uniref:SRPBCC family protein n=1 Tax=Mycolicibacterium sp. BiH015 TaxID=3018808 RepID=UPI0022E786B1|nr:SRPBCC family protein [Mycolicibacterium sp. BiH015]MDA2894914.1 SRPBCC family protein [Mycolicibacterium sp. BiH015]